MLHLTTADDIQLAKEAYVYGSLTHLKMHPSTYSKIRGRVPAPDSTAYRSGAAARRELPGPDVADQSPDPDNP